MYTHISLVLHPHQYFLQICHLRLIDLYKNVANSYLVCFRVLHYLRLYFSFSFKEQPFLCSSDVTLNLSLCVSKILYLTVTQSYLLSFSKKWIRNSETKFFIVNTLLVWQTTAVLAVAPRKNDLESLIILAWVFL